VNRTLGNLAAICIILATVYGGMKEVLTLYSLQQAQRAAAIDQAEQIIDNVLGQ
jgi:hypothetical protein